MINHLTTIPENFDEKSSTSNKTSSNGNNAKTERVNKGPKYLYRLTRQGQREEKDLDKNS